MIKKTLMTTAAAMAITAGAFALQPTTAEAGYYGHGYHGHYGGYYCKRYKVRIRYWSHRYYGWRYRWAWRSNCY